MSKTLKKVLSVFLCAALLFGVGGSLSSLSLVRASGAASSSILSAGPEGSVLANKSGTPLNIVTKDDVTELKLVKQGGATEVWNTGASDNGDGTKTWSKKYTFTEGRHGYTAYAATASGYEADGVDFVVNATSQKVTITLGNTGLGLLAAYYNGGIKKSVTGTSKLTVAKGDVITLTANPKTLNGYTYSFLYWNNKYTSRAISTADTYKFMAVCDMNIESQFSPNSLSEDENNKFVVYINNAGNVLKNIELKPGESYTPPAVPVLQDHTFKNWSMTPEEAIASEDRSIVITPIYTMEDAYTVSIQEGDYETWGAGEYVCKDDARALVNINASATNGAGQVFQYWLDCDTNEIVSYGRGYMFYVIKDTVLCPVYGDEPVTPQPVVRFAAVKFSKARVTFYAERSVPGAYEVIQTGILATKTESIGTNADSFVLGADGVSRGTSISKSPDGLYSGVVSLDFGETVWSRAFLICRDTAGEIHTIYSPISSYTR